MIKIFSSDYNEKYYMKCVFQFSKIELMPEFCFVVIKVKFGHIIKFKLTTKN